MTTMCLEFLLVLIQSQLLLLSFLILYWKVYRDIRLLFYKFFSWRTHYRQLSLLTSSSYWRCLRRLHMLYCSESSRNIFLLCIANCICPCVFFVLLIRTHLKWISSTIFSFGLIVWFPYGLRMWKIGVNVYWLTIWIFWAYT